MTQPTLDSEIQNISDRLAMKDAKKAIPTFVEQHLQVVPGLSYCVTREYFVYYNEETAKQKIIESNKSFNGLENIRRLTETEFAFFNS